jgi:hypothetical protein
MRIPRTAYLALQALPGAGGQLCGGTFEYPWGTEVITFYISYEGASATGSPQFEVEIGNGVELCRTIVVDSSSLAIVQPNASVDFYLEQLDGPVPGDEVTICYILRVCPKMGERTIRLCIREVGDEDNPGTIEVFLTGGGSEQ